MQCLYVSNNPDLLLRIQPQSLLHHYYVKILDVLFLHLRKNGDCWVKKLGDVSLLENNIDLEEFITTKIIELCSEEAKSVKENFEARLTDRSVNLVVPRKRGGRGEGEKGGRKRIYLLPISLSHSAGIESTIFSVKLTTI